MRREYHSVPTSNKKVQEKKKKTGRETESVTQSQRAEGHTRQSQPR